MTSDQIVYDQQRVRVLAHSRESGNVSETCRTFGISRKTFYKWRHVAQRYGLAALWPRHRRQPTMPNATPTHIVETLLSTAVTSPTLGCRQYADGLAGQGFEVSKSTVQNLLVAHGLGRRQQRLARTAAIAAMTTGLITEAALEDEPFGFCHWAPAPGDLVAIDSFYIGNLKGVGKVHQLTAVDTFTRWAIVWIVHGPITADVSIRFLERIRRQWARLGYPIRAIVADNGPEYVATRSAVNCLSRFAWSGFMPPYWATRRCQVKSAISRCHHPNHYTGVTSAIGGPHMVKANLRRLRVPVSVSSFHHPAVQTRFRPNT